MSAAHDAARSGDVRMLEEALDHDERAVRLRDKLQRTPLHLAAWAGHAALVAVLISRGADVHAEAVDGIRAIHFAAQNGHDEAVKELLKARSKVNVRDTKKLNTPLHFAASKGHASTVAYLLKKNADATSFNRARKTPVDVASTDEVRQVFLASAGSSNGDLGADTDCVPEDATRQPARTEDDAQIAECMPMGMDSPASKKQKVAL